VATALFVAGTVPFALLGVVHLALTVRDLREATYFRPTDDALVAALGSTGVTLLARWPGARTMWRAWLGANLTHGIGLLLFALVLLAVALHDDDLIAAIGAIHPLSISAAVLYTAIAARFWFLPAAVTAGTGLVLFVAAALA
jgi:hypothetical protein